jgi:glucosyl-dolichyl phosphate glucuronosyltransferase
MEVSVILCTYNRCQSLARALASVADSALPPAVEWEVLVVDNNSTDKTRAVVEDFIRLYPDRFRYLFEGQQGKSHALNRGIQSARGEVLAFTDDDVTVEFTWLQNLTAELLDDKCAGVGGRILPDWPCALPSWLPDKERCGTAPLAMFDFGLESSPLTEPPFGANMAFQKSMFEKYGGFRTDLGPRPNSEIRNEDTEFGRRLLVAGEMLKYAPTAVVYHSVPAKRLQKEYFLNWWFDKGRADVRQAGLTAGTKWFVAGVPLHLFRRLTANILRCLFTIESARRFAHRLAVSSLAGAIVESYCQSRNIRHREGDYCKACDDEPRKYNARDWESSDR